MILSFLRSLAPRAGAGAAGTSAAPAMAAPPVPASAIPEGLTQAELLRLPGYALGYANGLRDGLASARGDPDRPDPQEWR